MLCDIGGHVMDVRTVCTQLFEAVSGVFLLVGVLIAPSMAAESDEEYSENLTHITNEIKEANGELNRTYNELYLLLSSRGRVGLRKYSVHGSLLYFMRVAPLTRLSLAVESGREKS